MKTFFVIIVICVSMISCEPEADLSRTFLIRKGEHYSTPRLIETLTSNELSFQAKFNSSAIYTFDDRGLQDSKNKLMGFADCNSQHHQNSARFSWQWYNDHLEIHAYCYVDGERKEKFVGVVDLDEYHEYTIRVEETQYVFTLDNGLPVYIERAHKCDKGIYYMLWPYFGGSLAAPHDVTIDIIRQF
jgi:hypothetical protein